MRRLKLWSGIVGCLLAAVSLAWAGPVTIEPADELAGTWVTAVADYGGSVWIGTGNAGLWEWEKGEIVQRVSSPTLPANQVLSAVAFEGKLWVGTSRGMAVYNGKKWEAITTLNGIGLRNCSLFVAQNRKRLWMTSLFLAGRVMVKEAGKEGWEIFDPDYGTILNNVTSIMDAGRDIYLGTTASGIYAYHDGQRKTITKKDGLLDNRVGAMAMMGDTLVVGHPTGLSFLKDGKWSIWASPPPGHITTIAAPAVGDSFYLLIGLKEGGVIIKDRDLKDVGRFDSDAGLPYNAVSLIQVVGEVTWVGTPRGASRLRFQD